MSKIGKKLIVIPDGVSVTVTPYEIVVKGATHEKTLRVPAGVKPKLEGTELTFELLQNSKQARSSWGTIRALVANAIEGTKKPFSKKLILEGVGFRIAKEGNDLNFNLGFSHPVKYTAPENITFEVEKNTILIVKGPDKEVVGQVAAEIRALKKPDPYKGKGFRYSTEVIRRKAGKKAASTGASA